MTYHLMAYYHTLVQMLKKLNHSLFTYTFTFALSHVFVYISYRHSTCCIHYNVSSSLIQFSDILDKKKSHVTFILLYTVMKCHWQGTITSGKDRLLICAVCFMFGCHVTKCNKIWSVLYNIRYTKLKVGAGKAYSI